MSSERMIEAANNVLEERGRCPWLSLSLLFWAAPRKFRAKAAWSWCMAPGYRWVELQPRMTSLPSRFPGDGSGGAPPFQSP